MNSNGWQKDKKSNGRVMAWGYSSIEAYDNTKIAAKGYSKVLAYDKCQVCLCYGASARAYNNVKAEVHEDSWVGLSGKSSAKVWDLASASILCGKKKELENEKVK